MLQVVVDCLMSGYQLSEEAPMVDVSIGIRPNRYVCMFSAADL